MPIKYGHFSSYCQVGRDGARIQVTPIYRMSRTTRESKRGRCRRGGHLLSYFFLLLSQLNATDCVSSASVRLQQRRKNRPTTTTCFYDGKSRGYTQVSRRRRADMTHIISIRQRLPSLLIKRKRSFLAHHPSDYCVWNINFDYKMNFKVSYFIGLELI